MKIYKYPIYVTDEQTLRLPANPKALCIKKQNDSYFLWAFIDEHQTEHPYTIYCVGTGHSANHLFRASIEYIDTVIDGSLVWHFFIETL